MALEAKVKGYHVSVRKAAGLNADNNDFLRVTDVTTGKVWEQGVGGQILHIEQYSQSEPLLAVTVRTTGAEISKPVIYNCKTCQKLEYTPLFH